MHRSKVASRSIASAALALPVLLASLPASAETWSDWYYVRSVDPSTNAVSAKAQVVIRAKSDEDLYTLGVTCAAGRVAVSLQSTTRHFKPGEVEATWKTDRGNQHAKDPWQVLAKSDQVLFAQSPQELLSQLTKGKKLSFSVSDATGQSVNLVFPIFGAKEAIMIAFAECRGKSGAGTNHEPIETDATYLLLHTAELQYPDRAKRADKAGTARVSYTVTEEGKVEDPKVLTEDPVGLGFGDAAVSCVKRWRYQPEVKDGKAVRRAGVEVLIRFTLHAP